ncbi:glutaredoxin domain-containing protein [Denitratisoma oestradiolicum]|uniref:glutaredoxin domain-containing protein n=1 Tax=Denitratisoma oestradiolicum TaxID=311182 RepID=UPI0011A441FA|nr:glutaredoxin domain-containing protein [Denitratisoma oestradiolicum]
MNTRLPDKFLSRFMSQLHLILALCCCLWIVLPGQATAALDQTMEIEIFVSTGCPHCAAARSFIDELAHERRDLKITITDIHQDPSATVRLQALSQAAGVMQPGVPTLHIGSEIIVGFDTPATTGADIRRALERRSAASPNGNPAPSGTVEIPFTGQQLSVETLGLPLFTIVIGLLDGLNPCAMWVLVLMLSLLASLGDRRRMLAVAGSFVLVQGLAYFAFMAAWLNLFLLIGLSRLSEALIGAIALIAGLINLKDFLRPGRGISLSIPAAARPGIYARLRAILQAERTGFAVAGAVLLAMLVQVVELMCTSGFPALYTRILTLRQLDTASYYGYLVLYNLMYMFDDVVVLGIGVATLSQHRLQEREGRLLKLIAGLAMAGLGTYLLMRH